VKSPSTRSAGRARTSSGIVVRILFPRTAPPSPILPMRIDERGHRIRRRSSSTWARRADAFLKISLARCSSRFSRWSSFIRPRSSVVTPPRRSVSISLRRTHARTVSGVQPILPAIDAIAPTGTCARVRARSPSALLAPVPPGSTPPSSPCPHPLKLPGLRQSRGGSVWLPCIRVGFPWT